VIENRWLSGVKVHENRFSNRFLLFNLHAKQLDTFFNLNATCFEIKANVDDLLGFRRQIAKLA